MTDFETSDGDLSRLAWTGAAGGQPAGAGQGSPPAPVLVPRSSARPQPPTVRTLNQDHSVQIYAAGLALALALGAPAQTWAALTCAGPGLVGIGAWSCTETVSLSPRPLLANTTLFLDLWSPAASGFSLPAGTSPTLEQVSYSASATLNAAATVTNTSAQFQNASVREQITVTFASGAGTPRSLTTLSMFRNSGLIAFADMAPGESRTFPGALSGPLGPVSNSSSLPSALSQWLGTGQFQENVSASSAVVITGGGGNVQFSESTFFVPSFTLVYAGSTVLSAVPEVDTASLIMSGLLCLVVSMRLLHKRPRRRDTGRSGQCHISWLRRKRVGGAATYSV